MEPINFTMFNDPRPPPIEQLISTQTRFGLWSLYAYLYLYIYIESCFLIMYYIFFSPKFCGLFLSSRVFIRNINNNTARSGSYKRRWIKSRHDLNAHGGGTVLYATGREMEPPCATVTAVVIGALLTSFRHDGVSLRVAPNGVVLSLLNKRALYVLFCVSIYSVCVCVCVCCIVVVAGIFTHIHTRKFIGIYRIWVR